jgi:hypothetical protein
MTFLSQRFNANGKQYECVNYSVTPLANSTMVRHRLIFEPGSRELAIDTAEEDAEREEELEDAMNDKITSILLFGGQNDTVQALLA